MHSNSESIRKLLEVSLDWEKTLLSRLQTIKDDRQLENKSVEALVLAESFEHCVPDRSHAIAAYVLCYKFDKSQLNALSRARVLSIELCDFATAARLSRVHYQQSQDPRLLHQEGTAWLDAGNPDRALAPLVEALRYFPESEELQCELQCARQEWPDARAEIARLKGVAIDADSGEVAARALLQAARTMRMLNCNQGEMDKYLLTAFKADSENSSTLGLLGRRLPHLAYPDALWVLWEERINKRTTPLAAVEEQRRLATILCSCESYRDLGLRVAQRALDEAYESELVHIPGHLALHSLLFAYCEEAQLTKEYLNLIDRGLELPLPHLDQLFLCVQGLVLTLNSGDDSGAASYATMVQTIAPQHPLVATALERGLVNESVLVQPDASNTVSGVILSKHVDLVPAYEEVDDDFQLIDDILIGWQSEDDVTDVYEDFDMPEAPKEVSRVERPPSAPTVEVPKSFGAVSSLPEESLEVLRSSARKRNQPPPTPEPRASRLLIPLAIDILVEGKEARGLTRDLSESGAFILGTEPLPIGAGLLINVHLPEEIGSLKTRVFTLDTRVSRLNASGYGVEFVQPSEIFLQHLRELFKQEG
ncbi:MAG: PilZ domain-containing protein [Kofleriaceae bacterium]|nr:PilZ domain-containing protein [Kofleriaceae bacterium]